MVNGPLPGTGTASAVLAAFAKKATGPKRLLLARTSQKAGIVFAEILGKFYFFNLLENLRLILLDYGQKRPGTANAAFKAAC